MKKYVYPKLPAVKENPFFRIGGNGLANCLFVYAKAIVEAKKHGAEIIAPTWFNLSISTYLRRQADKRHYLGQITSHDEIKGIRRLYLLTTKSKTSDSNKFDSNILIVKGIYDFFKPLLPDYDYVRKYILNHISPKILKKVNDFDFSNFIAVHIRLGDFPVYRRVPMEWYLSKINELGHNKKVLLFSDGTNEELSDILALPNVHRVYFGGAIQDIVAISKCDYVIGSDSSFSAWGAFLGQVPCCFYKLQFGTILADASKQTIEIEHD